MAVSERKVKEVKERKVKEVEVGGDRKGGDWAKFNKSWGGGGVGNIRVLHKLWGLAPLCHLCEETLKICHPSHCKSNPLQF